MLSDRRAESPGLVGVERARVNVTRALRAAAAKLSEALPEAGTVLAPSERGKRGRHRGRVGTLRWCSSRLRGSTLRETRTVTSRREWIALT